MARNSNSKGQHPTRFSARLALRRRSEPPIPALTSPAPSLGIGLRTRQTKINRISTGRCKLRQRVEVVDISSNTTVEEMGNSTAYAPIHTVASITPVPIMGLKTEQTKNDGNPSIDGKPRQRVNVPNIGGSSLIPALSDAFEGTNNDTANTDEDVNPGDTEVKECPAPGEGSG